MPEGLESIESKAFYNNNISNTLWIPSSVNYLAKDWCDNQIHCNELVLLCNLHEVKNNSNWGISGPSFFAENISLWSGDMSNIVNLRRGIKHPIDSLDYICTPTSLVCNGIYSNNKRIGVKSIELTEQIDLHHIVSPGMEGYRVPFVVTFEDGQVINFYKDIYIPSVWLNTNSPIVTSASKAILISETNITEQENNIGFEIRKFNAPETLPSTRIPGYLYNGLIEGSIGNLTPTYYNVRSFYQPEYGETQYGEWVTFDAADFSQSDPVVHTYENTEISGTTATLKGVAIEGTDILLKEGFEYWTSTSQKLNVELEYTQSGVFSMAINKLKPNTLYHFRAYAKTNNGVIYGEDFSFSTGESSNDTDEPTYDTDVNMFENVVFFEKAEATTGQQITLSLMMNNTIAPTGFQCDLYLPAGITVATDDDDFNMISLSTKRTTLQKTNYFDSAEQRDGSVRIMCNSTKNYTFTGNDGEVALVTLNISDDIDEGDYPVVLKNIVISDAAANSYEVDYVKSTLTISSYTLGDANNDSKINVSDFSAIAGYIMGEPIARFVEKAADINTDGKINVSDLTGVATIILYGSPNRPLNIKSREGVSETKAFLNANNYSVNAGNEFVVDININGNYAFSGYQFDMTLPQGISVKTIDEVPCAALSHDRTDSHSTDFFTSRIMEDGKLRVLAASTRGNCFEGNNGSVARITLAADEDAMSGDYKVEIDNAIIADKGRGMVLDASDFTVSVDNVTGIQNMAGRGESSINIYDLTGKIVKRSTSLKGLNKGIYIIDGKKVIK